MTEQHRFTKTILGKDDLDGPLRGEEQKFVDHMIQLSMKYLWRKIPTGKIFGIPLTSF